MSNAPGSGGDRAQLDRLYEVFHAVVELPPEEREAALREQCAGSEELYRAALALLAGDVRTARTNARPDQVANASTRRA